MDVTTKIKVAGGYLYKLTHKSSALSCDMRLNVFIPGGTEQSQKFPVLFYLSGLTCTPDNCTEKGGFFNHCGENGLAMVLPDTSPRNVEIEGQDDSWDFGSGAGFYLNATQNPWSKHYKMENYVVEELPKVVGTQFPQLDMGNKGITGHSMGGYGALTLYLKYPDEYKSVSAFSPIANPVNCPWGEKAFSGYLGSDKSAWAQHDPTELVKSYKGDAIDVLIDCGEGDDFYKQKQLLPENLVAAAKGTKFLVDLRLQPDYDHSYYFVSSFSRDHVLHHSEYLCHVYGEGELSDCDSELSDSLVEGK